MRVFMRARRLIAVGAGAAASVAVLGLPAAHADSQPPDVSAIPQDTTLAPGSPGKTVQTQIEGAAAAPVMLTGVTVSYDVAGLAGVATLTPQSGKCTTSGTVVTCHLAGFTVGTLTAPAQPEPYLGLETQVLTLVPAAGAVAGASGSYTVLVAAAGAAPSQASTVNVSLADGPDLQVKGATTGLLSSIPVTAGSTYRRALTFTNVGDQAAQGVTVEIRSDGYGLDIAESYKNCQYQAPTMAYCYIPDLVAPGATEKLSPAIEALTATDLMWQGLNIRVVPGYASLSTYTLGTGKAVTLVDASGAAQQPVGGKPAQSAIDSIDALTNIFLTVGGSSADLAATASLFPGQVPGQYVVDPEPFNNGPGFIELGRSGSYFITYDVVFPAGVTVVSVPSGWHQVTSSTPGATEYQISDGIELAGGTASSQGGQAVVEPQPGFAGADGTVTVGIDFQPTSYVAGMYMGEIDSDTTNDTATFTIPAYGS